MYRAVTIRAKNGEVLFGIEFDTFSFREFGERR